MDETIEHQLAQRMSALPPDIQAAIHSADLPKKVQEIGQRYQLHIDQIWQLDDEVMLIMLGFADPDTFIESLVREVHIPQATAEHIATDVSNELFMPIRESMRSFSEARAPQAASHPATPTPEPVKPKLEFPKADIMLTQKTVTPPASAFGSTSISNPVAVPSKLGALTTPPPAVPKAPIMPVPPPPPVPPVSHVAPPMTTLPPKISPSMTIPTAPPVNPSPTPATISPAPMAVPAAPASLPVAPTPPSEGMTSAAPATAPAPNGYKTDPYREPIE